ncbi:Similar to S.cerevisiae protein GAP1 (General amino acid permease) [Malassezia sympodialis ATCC 42132]|uniref:Similar to S.cerevisiae protein GAP1 (General amino acid permease) n=2 Tax=Malassezia sympodialis (strain ATCC 42132) TaxID=1230383 RepID=A0A1M8A274_MALS4|nr:Similar to S.cerevisiae protein GAP1 (General amino acid permease) [Malassezia sympodialis ATCC 42132]
MGIFSSWADSFKRADTQFGADPDYASEFVKEGGDKAVLGNEDYANATSLVHTDNGGIAVVPEKSALKRNLHNRHIQFIALGGGIGTGLFIGSGSELATGGPGSLIINFLIVGVMIMCVVFSLGELASTLPVSGAFSAYASRFVDPAWGFAVGWNYYLQWLIVMPLEFTAAAIVIQFWDPDQKVPPGIWIMIFFLVITAINLFGVRGYAEFEFFATALKVITVLGLIITLICIDCGGTPSNKYLGTGTWHNPGAFNAGFKGFCSSFTGVAFAFAGTELVGLASAETAEPRKVLPKACQQVVIRIVLFYILSLLLVTFVVPYNDPRLTNGHGHYDPHTSPFVIALRIGQIKVLPHIVNAVIIVSTLSVANSSVYASSRTMLSLAEQGFAPSLFKYVDRAGRPLPAVIVSLAFGLLAFLIYASNEGTIFSWMLSISGLSAIFAWGSICLCHIRFRAAWKYQGLTLRQLSWASPLGTIGSYIGLSLCILVVIATFYVSAFPIGEASMNGNDRAENFFNGMISLVIVIVFGLVYKLFARTRFVRLGEMDIHTGRRESVGDEVLEQEQAEKRAQPMWKRVLGTIF